MNMRLGFAELVQEIPYTQTPYFWLLLLVTSPQHVSLEQTPYFLLAPLPCTQSESNLQLTLLLLHWPLLLRLAVSPHIALLVPMTQWQVGLLDVSQLELAGHVFPGRAHFTGLHSWHVPKAQNPEPHLLPHLPQLLASFWKSWQVGLLLESTHSEGDGVAQGQVVVVVVVVVVVDARGVVVVVVRGTCGSQYGSRFAAWNTHTVT